MERIKEKYLVVNADDFGIDLNINRGVAESYRCGIVRSVSLLANGREFENAVSLIGSMPGVGVGVHLCLVGERPILPMGVVSSLVDGKGDLYPSYAHFLLRLWTGRICLRQVEMEFEAQIKQVLNRGIILTHLDSHQYIHFIPEMQRILVRLAKKYNIGWIRYPTRLRGIHYLTLSGLAKKAWLSSCGRNQADNLRSQGIGVADQFYVAPVSGRLDQQTIKTCFQQLTGGISDLTCHPGYFPSDGRYAHWNYRWEEELRALTDQEVLSLVKTLKIRLGSYALEERHI